MLPPRLLSIQRHRVGHVCFDPCTVRLGSAVDLTANSSFHSMILKHVILMIAIQLSSSPSIPKHSYANATLCKQKQTTLTIIYSLHHLCNPLSFNGRVLSLVPRYPVIVIAKLGALHEFQKLLIVGNDYQLEIGLMSSRLDYVVQSGG